MAANLRDPGSIPGGDPKRFQDSSNYVFHIVGECFSRAARTHLAMDLTCKEFRIVDTVVLLHLDSTILWEHRLPVTARVLSSLGMDKSQNLEKVKVG